MPLPIVSRRLVRHLIPVLLGIASGAQAQAPAALRGDWTLDAVLASASARHPLVEAARARVAAARGERRSVGAVPNPLVTWQVENAAFPGDPQPAGLDRETSTFVTLPLEALYQRWPRVRRADENTKAAEAAVVAARRQVVLDAARAFHRVALAQVSVAAAREVTTGLERLVAFNRARVAEGVTAEGDLIRVQVELGRAMADEALAGAELARARADLRPFLGADTRPLDSIRVRAESTVTVASLPPVAALREYARTHRPELLAARARAAAAGAEATLQRTLVVRQVGAVFGSKRIGAMQTMTAGVSLPVPLPMLGQNAGDIERAVGERRATGQELAWTERTVAADLDGAYEAAVRLGGGVAQLQGEFLSRAEEARRIAVAAYEEGAASLLQVLDASRTLSEARLTYHRTLFAYEQGILALAVAAGADPGAMPAGVAR